MKKLIAVFLLTGFFQLHAQKNLDGLTNAEKNFAAYCVEHGTKNAFLKFIDSNGIVFDNGQPKNGIELWTKRENRPFILNWHPQFAEIALSNDFGYTTGPWTLQPNGTDSITARGQYITVWHLDKNDEWKFLVDLGVGNTPANASASVQKINVRKVKSKGTLDEVVKAEQRFITVYKNDKADAYRKFLSAQSILNRNRLLPATGKTDQLELIANTPNTIQYSIEGSGIAPGGDLAYVYGNTVINRKNENYLRIWRKEKSGWKIALEVLRYDSNSD